MKMCFQKLDCRWLLVLIGLFFNVPSISPIYAATYDRVVAKVNNDVITLVTLEDRAEAYLNQNRSSANLEEKELTKNKLMMTVLDIMVTERLQVQEAKKLGMTVSDETIEKAMDDIYKNNNITRESFNQMLESEGSDLDSYKEIVRDQILVSKIIKMRLRSGSAVKESSMRKFYINNKKKYWVPEKIVVRHILLLKESGLTKVQIQLIKKKAESIYQQIQTGEEFAKLAKKYSEDVSAHSGGLLGVISRGAMMPIFEEAAFNLKVGEVSKVVETVNGFHIIKCDNKIPGHSKKYKTVRSEIEEIMLKEKRESEFNKWSNDLKEKSFVEISLFEDKKHIRNVRPNNKKNRVKDSKAQLTVNSEVKLSKNKLIEKTLNKYKKLYEDGKITKKIFLKKKRRLLERL